MSGIRPLGPGAGPQAGSRAGRAGGSGGSFRLPGEGEAAEAADGTSAPVATGAVGLGLLSLQAEAEEDSARNARARRRAERMLDELRQLQAELLLAGGADPARLARLALLAEGEAAADPALQEILEGIAVRARVEAARAVAPSLSQRK